MYNFQTDSSSPNSSLPSSPADMPEKRSQFDVIYPQYQKIENSIPSDDSFSEFDSNHSYQDVCPESSPVHQEEELTVIDGVTYNNRGYEICGVLNQHRKPCQRIGNCPFHKNKKEKTSTDSKDQAVKTTIKTKPKEKDTSVPGSPKTPSSPDSIESVTSNSFYFLFLRTI
jgi:hypothetical protein